MQKIYINPDISIAETLPASFYRDPEIFSLIKDKIFMKSWQWIGDENLVRMPGSVYPFIMLDQYLTEPMLLTRAAEDQLYCLTNVCTHRGNLVAHHPGQIKKLSCLYHGRKFALDGTFESMPEFTEAKDFPRPCDSLHQFPLEKWGPFLFAGLNPAFDLKKVFDKMNERIGFLPLDAFRYEPSLSKDYLVHAHWVLYCDNYLEGFHIPFVHKELNAMLDYGTYTTELYDHMSLQIGYSDNAEEIFDLPEGHPDYGKKVAAYYYWIYPNMMFNFYPWGLSINIVKPIGPERTRVSFISYVYDDLKLDRGAGAVLDKVEREDEYVVEGVQKGVKSRFYQAGRYSPTKETGVHYFHSLIANDLNA